MRTVKPRATVKKTSEEEGSQPPATDAGPIDAEGGQEARDSELAEELLKKQEEEKWVMVCRPKAGQLVVGGGFLALWRRMESVSPAGSQKETTGESGTESEI